MSDQFSDSSVLSSLNTAQKEAVTATEGFIRVIAGAGTGKTRALSHRFAYLVQEIGVLPGTILCVTFTNKAAAEMRQRIRRLTGDSDTGYISTFHSFCVTVLQEDSSAVQYPKHFLVLDNADIDTMLQTIYDERGLTLRQMTFGKARDMIEIRKLKKNPDYYTDLIAMSLEALHQKYRAAEKPDDIIFYGYLYQEKKCFGLDYNDLIKFVLYIFTENEDIRLKWQQRLEYIMVDEFQDIDDIQYQLMEVLCGYHKNLFIVGDPDQTIYTWRGADIRFLLDFDKKFPSVQTVMMTENYRSTPEILAAANSLIDKNKNRIKKELIAACEPGPNVLYHHAKTSEGEALWIADRIRGLQQNGVEPGDICILYRAHYISRQLEEVFAREKIPFTMYSGIQFFDREEIKDALSYLRIIAFKDDLSFRRIVNKPKRNIGRSRMAFLESYAEAHAVSLYEALCSTVSEKEFAHTHASQFIALVTQYTETAKEKPVSELLGMLLDASGYEYALRTAGSQTRLDNLAELKQSVYEFETSCGEECTPDYYLAHAALMTGLDVGSSKKAVKLMTIHTAKGLEFPHVILCGMDEGMFPSRKVQDRSAMEEERRLAFVACTRAEKTLALTDAEGRNLDGSVRYPSRFIFDIGRKNLDYTVELDESFTAGAESCIRSSEKALDASVSASSFLVGERISHCIQGPGTILELDYVHKAFIIQFDRMPTPRKISFRAQLQKLPQE